MRISVLIQRMSRSSRKSPTTLITNSASVRRSARNPSATDAAASEGVPAGGGVVVDGAGMPGVSGTVAVLDMLMISLTRFPGEPATSVAGLIPSPGIQRRPLSMKEARFDSHPATDVAGSPGYLPIMSLRALAPPPPSPLAGSTPPPGTASPRAGGAP